MALRIPDEHKPAIAKLLMLPDETAAELASVIRNTALELYQDRGLDKALSKISSIRSHERFLLLEMLMSLYATRSNIGVSSEDFADQVLDATERAKIKELALTKENRDKFKKRLVEFLNIKTLAIASKAVGILFENEHCLTSARIVTDIRPVFGDDVSNAPDAAMIVHMLKIEYVHRGEPDEFFVALDTKDIEKLMDVLRRAQTKAKSIELMLQKATIPYLAA